MKPLKPRPPPQARSRPSLPRGVVMLYGLVALAIMLIGAVAVVRSMNTSLVNAGNLGFKRDLTNQGERAVAQVLTLMQTGALGTETARQSTSAARNYSATLLTTNPQGVPLALLNDATFVSVGSSANDVAVAVLGVSVRYVVDRLCVNTGLAEASHCTMAESPIPLGGGPGIGAEDSTAAGAGAVPLQVVYRMSIRVDGPRQTQAFFQSTFTL